MVTGAFSTKSFAWRIRFDQQNHRPMKIGQHTSFNPNPVIARTSLITLIFALASTAPILTSKLVFSSTFSVAGAVEEDIPTEGELLPPLAPYIKLSSNAKTCYYGRAM